MSPKKLSPNLANRQSDGQKKEQVARALGLVSAGFLGYELARTVKHSKKEGYGYFFWNRETGSYFMGLVKDDVGKLVQVAGHYLPGSKTEEMVIDSDNTSQADLEEVTEMAVDQIKNSLQSD